MVYVKAGQSHDGVTALEGFEVDTAPVDLRNGNGSGNGIGEGGCGGVRYRDGFQLELGDALERLG